MNETSPLGRTRCHVFIACTLDGYIASRDGGIEWLEPYAAGPDDHGYSQFIATIDALVMGRNTYQTALSFGAWPYDKPVIVASRTLTGRDVPAELTASVQITRDPPDRIVTAAQANGWTDLYVDGGQLIQSFLAAGLIDDLVITRVPIILGEGIPLFFAHGPRCPLEHRGTTAFESGLVQSRYVITPAQSSGPSKETM